MAQATEREADLSGRELVVLRMLRSPLTERDIGRELYVSHNTVHSHTKSIYRKLGVSSRRQAVQRAVTLGLLPRRRLDHLGESERGPAASPIDRPSSLSMARRATRGGTYTVVVRGELDDRCADLFDGMNLARVAGTTVLSGRVVDQAQLHRHIARVEELGLELVSVAQAAEPAD